MDTVEKGTSLLRKLIIFVLAYEVVCAILLLAAQFIIGGSVVVQLTRSIVSVGISAFLFIHLYKGSGWARIICLVRFGFSAIMCLPTIISEPEFIILLYSVACLVIYTLAFTLLLSNKDIRSYMERGKANATQ